MAYVGIESKDATAFTIDEKIKGEKTEIEIDYIKVNELTVYLNALTKPIGENGELDLTQFKAGDKIEIVYH